MKKLPTASPDRGAISVFEWLAVAYILAPVLVFLLRWITLPVAVVATSLLTWSVVASLVHSTTRSSQPTKPTKAWFVILALAVSFVWVLLSGISGHFYANAFDWTIRFALARDLSIMTSPVTYLFEGQTYLLRAALGYFLVPSELAQIFGVQFLQTILFIWTVIGVAIFFIIAFGNLSIRQAVTSCILFIFCSGLDYYGMLLFSNQPPVSGSHLEWWAGNLQYSSNTTLLFWVPNHTIAAWIATALYYRFRNQLWFIRITPALVVALLIWSPLSGAGFVLLWLAGSIPFNVTRNSPMLRHLLFVLPAATIVLLYLTEGVGNISGQTPLVTIPSPNFIAKITLFEGIEFLIFVPFIAMMGRIRQIFPSIFCLVILPFFSFGPSNDFVLRTSIPALTFFWLVLTSSASQDLPKVKLHTRLVIFLIPFSIGAMTPFFEITRAVVSKPWKPELSRDLPTAFLQHGASTPFPPHYFTKLDGSILRKLLKKREPE